MPYGPDVPNSSSFGLQDIALCLYGATANDDNLNQCFTDAHPLNFDPTYNIVGQTAMSEFRNYRNEFVTMTWNTPIYGTTGPGGIFPMVTITANYTIGPSSKTVAPLIQMTDDDGNPEANYYASSRSIGTTSITYRIDSYFYLYYHDITTSITTPITTYTSTPLRINSPLVPNRPWILVYLFDNGLNTIEVGLRTGYSYLPTTSPDWPIAIHIRYVSRDYPSGNTATFVFGQNDTDKSYTLSGGDELESITWNTIGVGWINKPNTSTIAYYEQPNNATPIPTVSIKEI